MRTCHTQSSGAQWRLGWRKGVSAFQHVLCLPGNSTIHCCFACGAYHFCSTPCMRMLPTHSCLLASVILTRAALSPPQFCFGCSTRDNVSSLWRYGTLLFHFLTAPCRRGVPFTLVSSNPPWSARTLVSSNPPPPFAPVSPGLSLCGSLSYSLPLFLSCSPLLFLSCCTSLFLSHCALPSLSLCFSLPLSRALSRPKRGFGLFGASLSPPGFEPSSTRQKRCGVSTEPRRWVICTMAPCAPFFFSFVSPPVMRIFFRMGVCSAVCRGTAQRPRVPGPPA